MATDKAARAARRAHAALDDARAALWDCLSPTLDLPATIVSAPDKDSPNTVDCWPPSLVDVSSPDMDRTFAYLERNDPEQPERWRRGARIRLLRTLAARSAV